MQQVLRTKGYRDRQVRFSNPPITKGSMSIEQRGRTANALWKPADEFSPTGALLSARFRFLRFGEPRGIVMSERDHQAAGCSFYTYIYGDNLSATSRRFYETEADARADVKAFRTELLKETGRDDLLPDMKIVRLDTVALSPAAIVSLFNDLDGKLGGFIRARQVVDVISEPQVRVERSGSVA